MKVSILIPVYNSERYLKKTIESALAQSWEDKEIIIVDDSSTDSSFNIASLFSSDTVKVLSKPNGGACSARNVAFTHSIGDYIQYLDADDLMSEDKIKYQLLSMSANNTNAVASCIWIRFTQESELDKLSKLPGVLDRNWTVPLEWLKNAWEGKGMGQTATWLTPRNLVKKAGPWNERLSINQDGEFFCRVLLHASSINYSMNSFVYYRSDVAGSITRDINPGKVEALLYSYWLYEQHCAEKIPDDSRLRLAIVRNYFSFIYTYYDLYPELVKRAFQYADSLQPWGFISAGGKSFQRLSQAIGFKNALVLRSVARKMFHKRTII